MFQIQPTAQSPEFNARDFLLLSFIFSVMVILFCEFERNQDNINVILKYK